MIPFPSDSYMRVLAEAIYSVAYLGWAILGDLSFLTSPPAGLSSEELSRSPLGNVAQSVRAAAELSVVPEERSWLEAAAEALEDVVERRNQIVHAYPATVEGEQTLYRWARATSLKAHEAGPVTEEELLDLQKTVGVHLRRLDELRLQDR